MKPALSVVSLSLIPIFQQLQWEEALLRVDQRNWCLINHGSPPAIVLGISNQIERHINESKLTCLSLPVIRRFSGGGSVVVDENTLFITLICQAKEIQITPFPSSIMQWSAGFYDPLFSCGSFSLRENDYVLGEKKFAGNAQSIIRNRWLHHSSILWDFNPLFMDSLQLPQKAPTYRNNRAHADFLCSLHSFWDSTLSFEEKFLEQLSRQFELVPTNLQEILEIAKTPHRQATAIVRS